MPPTTSPILRPTATATPNALANVVLGGEACFPPSPRIPTSAGSIGVLVGTPAPGSTVHLFVSASPVLTAAQDWKLIVRMTGLGDLHVVATHDDGTSVTPTQLESHTGSSSLDALGGSEWGVFLTFPKSGCWKLDAQRGSDHAAVWVLVLPRT
jgi:hypothetical protein